MDLTLTTQYIIHIQSDIFLTSENRFHRYGKSKGGWYTLTGVPRWVVVNHKQSENEKQIDRRTTNIQHKETTVYYNVRENPILTGKYRIKY